MHGMCTWFLPWQLLWYCCSANDFFETTHHNQPDIVMSATWKQLLGLHEEDGTPTTQEPLQHFPEPCRVSEEHPNPAQNYPEALENSDDFSCTGEFPCEIGTCNDSDDSENLTVILCRILRELVLPTPCHQVLVQACMEGSARCWKLWQNWYHNKVSTVIPRCSTWHHRASQKVKPKQICLMTITWTFKNAWGTRLLYMQKWWGI